MSKPYVIAEAAQGYEGSVELGRLLVRAAAAGKADAVKFQIVYVDELARPGHIHHDIFKSLEMPISDWQSIRDEATRRNLTMLADVFGLRSLEVGEAIGVDGYKLHSTTFFEHSLTAAVLATNKPVYLSVGGIHADEIVALIDRFKMRERGNVTLLAGFQAEPTPPEVTNLARIPALAARTGLPVGYMDHTDGDGLDTVTFSAAALGMGVEIFEKHVTLDRALEIEDYVSALPPAQFADYVDALNRAAVAIGSADLALTDDEQLYRAKALKRVLAMSDLPAGHVLRAADMYMCRHAERRGEFELEPMIGRQVGKAVKANDPIELE